MKTNSSFLLRPLLCLVILGVHPQMQAQTLPTVSAPPPIDSARVRRLESQFEQLRSLLGIPGLSAAIVKDRQLVWAKGFGFADVAKRVPATPHTLYYIASLTKTLAATALLQLVEQGKLDLEEPMSHYAAEFADDRVRIKHLLSHTSGDPPGDRFSYDGARFSLLTAVLEQKTGKSFRQLIAEMFLNPLSMSESVPSQDVLDIAKQNPRLFSRAALAEYRRTLTRYARPYRLYGDEIIRTTYPAWGGVSAASGLLSTVTDLAKFDAAIDRHAYLAQATQELAWTPFVSNSGRPLVHGLGWFVQTYRGVRCIWHFGNDPDEFSGTYLKVPEKGLTLILLANSDALSTPFYRNGILTTSPLVGAFLRLFVFEEQAGHILPDPDWKTAPATFTEELARLKNRAVDYPYDAEQRAYTAMQRWLDENRKGVRTAITVDPATLAPYRGRYRLADGTLLTVSQEGRRLFIQQSEAEKVELFPESSARFFAKVTDLELMFVTGADHKISRMEIYQGGQTLIAERTN
jgi:CubicO group peptidase (beta-lactamase class C family)